jgi:SHS2 domain-containing protein
MEPFQYLEHTADVKFLARGHTPEEMFENSAQAMFSAMTETSKVEERETWHVELEAEDLEFLLYDWLSELLYLFQVELALFSAFEVELEKDERSEKWKLRARVGGERIDPERHTFDTEVKAVTLHQFEVKKEEYWTAQVILDV